MLNLVQHRKIEVDELGFCRWKCDFHAPATLKRVQGDKKL